MNAFDGLDQAIDEDAYNWFMAQVSGGNYINAISSCLEAGRTPAQIQHYMAVRVGPDRAALAQRAGQAARHMARLMERAT